MSGLIDCAKKPASVFGSMVTALELVDATAKVSVGRAFKRGQEAQRTAGYHPCYLWAGVVLWWFAGRSHRRCWP